MEKPFEGLRHLLASNNDREDTDPCLEAGRHLDSHTLGVPGFGIGWCNACGEWWNLD